jgi:hypothetical protein
MGNVEKHNICINLHKISDLIVLFEQFPWEKKVHLSNLSFLEELLRELQSFPRNTWEHSPLRNDICFVRLNKRKKDAFKPDGYKLTQISETEITAFASLSSARVWTDICSRNVLGNIEKQRNDYVIGDK